MYEHKLIFGGGGVRTAWRIDIKYENIQDISLPRSLSQNLPDSLLPRTLRWCHQRLHHWSQRTAALAGSHTIRYDVKKRHELYGMCWHMNDTTHDMLYFSFIYIYIYIYVYRKRYTYRHTYIYIYDIFFIHHIIYTYVLMFLLVVI